MVRAVTCRSRSSWVNSSRRPRRPDGVMVPRRTCMRSAAVAMPRYAAACWVVRYMAPPPLEETRERVGWDGMGWKRPRAESEGFGLQPAVAGCGVPKAILGQARLLGRDHSLRGVSGPPYVHTRIGLAGPFACNRAPRAGIGSPLGHTLFERPGAQPPPRRHAYTRTHGNSREGRGLVRLCSRSHPGANDTETRWKPVRRRTRQQPCTWRLPSSAPTSCTATTWHCNCLVGGRQAHRRVWRAVWAYRSADFGSHWQ